MVVKPGGLMELNTLTTPKTYTTGMTKGTEEHHENTTPLETTTVGRTVFSSSLGRRYTQWTTLDKGSGYTTATGSAPVEYQQSSTAPSGNDHITFPATMNDDAAEAHMTSKQPLMDTNSGTRTTAKPVKLTDTTISPTVHSVGKAENVQSEGNSVQGLFVKAKEEFTKLSTPAKAGTVVGSVAAVLLVVVVILLVARFGCSCYKTLKHHKQGYDVLKGKPTKHFD